MTDTAIKGRQSLSGLASQFIERSSPRVFLDKPVSDSDMALIFEAARWSPSCYNEQPWRFYTSQPESYQRFLSLLVEPNKAWAKSAPVLGLVVANRRFERNSTDNYHADFDTGAAWMAMSLQAQHLGLSVHGMGGVHYQDAYEMLGIDPEAQRVLAAFALGYVDKSADEALSQRVELSEIWSSVN